MESGCPSNSAVLVHNHVRASARAFYLPNGREHAEWRTSEFRPRSSGRTETNELDQRARQKRSTAPSCIMQNNVLITRSFPVDFKAYANLSEQDVSLCSVLISYAYNSFYNTSCPKETWRFVKKSARISIPSIFFLCKCVLSIFAFFLLHAGWREGRVETFRLSVEYSNRCRVFYCPREEETATTGEIATFSNGGRKTQIFNGPEGGRNERGRVENLAWWFFRETRDEKDAC